MPEFLDWSIIGPAFAAGVIILSTHVPLGQEVLNRGIIFIDLAIAQVAGLGVGCWGASTVAAAASSVLLVSLYFAPLLPLPRERSVITWVFIVPFCFSQGWALYWGRSSCRTGGGGVALVPQFN